MKSSNSFKSMVFSFLSICLISPLGFTQGNYTPDENYNVGKEISTAIFKSIQKNRFNLQLSISATVDPTKDLPSVIDVFDMEALMAFKHDPQGLRIPLQAPDKEINKNEQKLQAYFSTNLNNIFAVMRVSRSEVENEFEGDLGFYSKSGDPEKVHADAVEVKISSELLDIKKLILYGLHLKISLPNTQTKKEDLKKGILNALINCKAATESIDLFELKKTQLPVEKCLFSFDGQKYRVEYKEARPKI